MTAVSTTWIPAGNTGAKLYACTKAMSDALTAVGLLKTADTGQIDLTSITSITPPTSAPANQPKEYAYEMRRLQAAGKPTIYIRVSYCVVPTAANSAATYRVAVYFRAGLLTDGAGTLAGATQVYEMNPFNYSTGPADQTSMTAVRNLYVASDGQNYLTVINDPLGLATTSGYRYGYMNFFCERTVDYLSGNYDSDGFISGNAGASGEGYSAFQILNIKSGNSYYSSVTPYQVPGTIFTSSAGLTTALIMPLSVVIPDPKGPAICSVLAYAADTTAGGQYDIAMYGVTRRYMEIGPRYTAAIPLLAPSDVRVLARFD